LVARAAARQQGIVDLEREGLDGLAVELAGVEGRVLGQPAVVVGVQVVADTVRDRARHEVARDLAVLEEGAGGLRLLALLVVHVLAAAAQRGGQDRARQQGAAFVQGERHQWGTSASESGCRPSRKPFVFARSKRGSLLSITRKKRLREAFSKAGTLKTG